MKELRFRASFLFDILVMLTACCKQLEMGKKGLVCELLLVLKSDPVTSFMIPQCMIFSIFFISLCLSLQLFTREVILVLREWIPSLGCQCTSERSLYQQCQKCSSDLILVAMASVVCWAVFWLSGVIVPVTMSVYRVCWYLPSNIILNCFQPLWEGSSSTASMSMASRKSMALV